MIDNNLSSYIEQNLKKGYSVSSIQNALINQGYPAKNVLDTLNYVKGNNQNTQKTAVQSPGGSKKGLYILIPIVLIIIIGVSIFFFTSFSSKSISEEEFSQGTSVNLKENKEVKFNLDDEVHTIKVDSVTDNSVSLTIQSNPIKVDMKIGEEKKFDLDNDGFYDIKIKLNNIIDGIPDLYIQKIHESTCVENWNCGGWSDCTEQGKQSRTCTDINSCGTSKNKPSTTQSCTYVKPCTEDWNCGSWSECTEQETQTRTCTDVNLCGTTKNKPSATQSCTYVEPQDIPECTNNNDCTQTCTNCEGGTYVCAYSSDPSINQKCVECINDFSCVDGYTCENNICIEEEDEPEEEPEAYPDTILDCYNEDFSEILCDPEKALEFTTIFETRLESCELSNGTFALGFEPFMGAFRGYEIQDELDGKCIVKFWFLENNVIDSSLLNKHMICEYNFSKRTTQDVNDCFEECCSGELVDVVNEIQS
jgi:hypothetical protein